MFKTHLNVISSQDQGRGARPT